LVSSFQIPAGDRLSVVGDQKVNPPITDHRQPITGNADQEKPQLLRVLFTKNLLLATDF
jgi:hypothetical protein